MKVFVLVCLFALLASCGPNEWYNQEVNIPSKGWHMDTVAVFNSRVDNLDKSVHLLIEVTNNDEYQYSNAWVFVDAVSPSGHTHRDTLIVLANVQGDWYGKSVTNDGYQSTHPYKLNIKFPEKGIYKYYVVHGMRDTVLTGLHSVGLRIIEVEE